MCYYKPFKGFPGGSVVKNPPAGSNGDTDIEKRLRNTRRGGGSGRRREWDVWRVKWKHTLSPIQFSPSFVSKSLRPHGLQHARPPCPSPAPGAYSNSCPLSQWCHPTISSSIVPFSSHLQSFPASGSFQISQFFALGGQSIGVSASAPVLPMNTQDMSPLGWTGWISLLSKGLSWKHILPDVKQRASVNLLRELKWGLSNNLEGWGGEGGGREVQEGWDIRMSMADSCWCLAEINIIL